MVVLSAVCTLPLVAPHATFMSMMDAGGAAGLLLTTSTTLQIRLDPKQQHLYRTALTTLTMSSSPRVILSRCTCGATKSSIPARSLSTSSKKAASTTPSSSSSSSSTSKNTHVHPIKPRQRWVMPDFQARKRAVNLPAPRAQKFENKVGLDTRSILCTQNYC